MQSNIPLVRVTNTQVWLQDEAEMPSGDPFDEINNEMDVITSFANAHIFMQGLTADDANDTASTDTVPKPAERAPVFSHIFPDMPVESTRISATRPAAQYTPRRAPGHAVMVSELPVEAKPAFEIAGDIWEVYVTAGVNGQISRRPGAAMAVHKDGRGPLGGRIIAGPAATATPEKTGIKPGKPAAKLSVWTAEMGIGILIMVGLGIVVAMETSKAATMIQPEERFRGVLNSLSLKKWISDEGR